MTGAAAAAVAVEAVYSAQLYTTESLRDLFRAHEFAMRRAGRQFAKVVSGPCEDASRAEPVC